MPTYTYRCLDCLRRFEIYMTFSEYGTRQPVCTHCGSQHVQRRINRVRVMKSDESRLESMADPAALDGLEENPRELGRMMREMSGQLGEDMGPEFNEVVSRLERGQSPDDIERDMPDLGEDDGGGLPGGFADD